MASQKIDELQIQIGSDASDAIRQLGNLATALNIASAAASKLGGMSGALKSFSHGIESLTRADLSGAIDNLTKLSRINLSNLKDKKVNIDISVSGADRMDRLRYAAAQAERDLSKSFAAMGKTLGKDMGMDTSGIKNVQTILRDMAHDVAGNGNAAAGVERLKEAISETAKVSTADLTGMRREYEKFLKDVENLSINPGQISKDEMAEWKKMGLERLLQKGGQRIDTDVFGFDSAFLAEHSNIIDAFSVPMDAPDQFVFLREKILEAQAALDGFVQTDAVTEKIDQIAETYREKIQSMMEATTSERMAGSADKIPLDLNIDQTRFEKQIQDAINAATNKEYSTKPIRLKIDNKQLQQNVEAAFSLVDLPKLPQFAAGFSQVADAISLMNQTNLKDTGITQLANSLKRLVTVDTSKFDPSVLRHIVAAITDISKIGDVSNSLNRFVSAIARLANAGDKAKTTADGMRVLVPRIEDAIKTLSNVGDINTSVSQFISSIAQLANAGDKAGKTAANLKTLTAAVVDFINEIRNAPDVDENLANTIHGLGLLADAGMNAQKAMSSLSGSTGGSNGVAGVLTNSIFSSAKMFAHDFAALNVQVLKLSGHGVKALAGFMQQLHLLPGGAANVDRTALSFMNLLRAIVPFYGIRGIFDWAKQSFEAGSSIVELRNVIDTAFGSVINGYRDISGYIYKWSQGTIDAFGVSEIAAQRYAGRLMSMFNSSGFDASEAMRDSAAQMTTDLIERAGDIASFYDIGVDEAMTKMQAALAGMSRPMRSLGVNMNIANLEAFALSQGIHQSWQEMDQATQMAVRYAYMLDATKYAEGDFGRTSMSAANQVRILQLNVQQLSATIGQGLVSAIAPVIAWLNALIKRLIQAAVAFRTFMWTLFGKPLAAVRGLVNDTAGYLDDAAGAASSLGDAGGGAADGLGSAGKAAKELKKQLSVLPFDELNQLAKDTDSAGSGGSGGGGGGGGVGGIGGLGDMGLMPDYDGLFEDSPVVEAINRWAARIREAFEKHQWKNLGRIVAEGINAGFQFIYDALSWSKIKPIIVDGFITPFQTTINSMADWINWDLIGRTFGRGLNDIVYTLRAWITGFHWRDYGTYLADGLNGMIDEWDAAEFGRLIADKFKAAWDFFGGWVSKFNFKGFGSKLKEMVLNGIDELDPRDMGNSLATFINGLADTLIEFLGDGSVKTEMSDAFAEFVNGFVSTLDAGKVKEGLKSAIDTIVGVAWETFKKVDMMPLIKDLITILGGLPWGLIGGTIAIHVIGAVTQAFTGGLANKLLIKGITKAFTSGGGASAAGAGAATSAATSAAASSNTTYVLSGPLMAGAGAGAAGGGSNSKKLSGLITGGLAIGTILSGLGIKKLMSVFGKSGGNKNTGSQPVTGTGGGRSFGPAPKATTPSPQSKSTATPTGPSVISGITAKINTILTGEKDPSFTNLELAKSSLLDTPIVKKIMNGEQTAEFKDGYKKFTDTKLYNVVKAFTGQDKGGFLDKYSKYVYTRAHNVVKAFTGQDKGGFLDKYSKYVYTRAHNVTKWFNGGNGNGFLDKFSKYTYTKTHNVTKWFTGENGNNFLDKFSKYIYTKSHNVTKWFTGKDGGNFVSYFSKFAYGLYDKTVKVTFDIITTAKNVVASIVGKGREILASIWTENARGGLFTGPTGFQVFGEAGAEAAIPLERKSTMKRIGNAIVNAGGMGTSNSEDIANAVAEKIAPIIMSAMSGQENRPINVNATLYTENNEVLARAVNQGNRSLDKRYNPVTQYSY